MKKNELAAILRLGLVSDEHSIEEAYNNLMQAVHSNVDSDKAPNLVLPLHLLLNSIAKEIAELEDVK